MNSKHLLLQIFISFVVSFNTINAVQVVQAKVAAPINGKLNSAQTARRDFNNGTIRRITGPYLSSAVTPLTSNTGGIIGISSNLDGFAATPKLAAPALVFQGPGKVLVPILLYHRIDVSPADSQYYVSPAKFEEQMKLLEDWGYTTITTGLLVKAITDGADLPLHPILITFDDGHLNNYATAFPIMQKYGFTGVVYIIGKYMGTPEYMNADQIKEMAKAGWEVGSHSMHHPDLTSLDTQQQQYEIIESRRFLETELGVPILTFAYPFGESNIAVVKMAYSAGYIAGMGIGYANNQGTSNLFLLQRHGVNGTRDLNSFASFLPWHGD